LLLSRPRRDHRSLGRDDSVGLGDGRVVGRKNSIRIPRTALSEAELDQVALPLNAFAENSRLDSPAMARLTP
jgi:hypothetical protein